MRVRKTKIDRALAKIDLEIANAAYELTVLQATRERLRALQRKTDGDDDETPRANGRERLESE